MNRADEWVNVKRLSSNLTPVYKFCFPGLWLVCGLYALTDYILAWGDSTFTHFLGVSLFWVVGGIMFHVSFGRLNSVYLANDVLYVSNFFRRIAIPLEHIQTVKRADFWTTKISKVVLTVNSSTPFGKRIEFSPASSAHEIVNELKCRAHAVVG